jgi:hypothetical protein
MGTSIELYLVIEDEHNTKENPKMVFFPIHGSNGGNKEFIQINYTMAYYTS